MANLSTVDMKMVDSLFGMYGGYVLNFSNKTFASFFSRDVGIDIYGDAYAIHGESKGKRLWGFLERAQAADVAKALLALWEIREIERGERGEVDKVPQSRERLSALLSKLGGPSLPVDASSGPAQQPSPAGPSHGALSELDAKFAELMAMNDAPQSRGYAFERFLKDWFDVWGLDAHASFRIKGAQIDGSFQHDAATYLVEAKWHGTPVDANMLHGFQGKLLEGPDWTRGLYVSYGGFSGDSFAAFTARRLIMMDGADIYFALSRRLDLGRVIGAKVRYHSERRQPFAKVTDLFPV